MDRRNSGSTGGIYIIDVCENGHELGKAFYTCKRCKKLFREKEAPPAPPARTLELGLRRGRQNLLDNPTGSRHNASVPNEAAHNGHRLSPVNPFLD